MEGANEETEANVIVEKPMECSDVEEDLAMLGEFTEYIRLNFYSDLFKSAYVIV